MSDLAGSTAESSMTLAAGNARPELSLVLNGNRSFLLPTRDQLRYTASVEDPEDRAAGKLDDSKLLVNATWVSDPKLADGLRRGEAQLPSGDLAYAAGASLIAGSDCYTCHKERSENVGPAYLAVAERYEDTQANIAMIAEKVIKGGNGNWGERLMSGHPALSQTNAETMVGYILSLNNGGLPLAGKVRPGQGNGSYVLAASYRDGGGKSTPPLTGQETIVLRPTRLEAEHAHDGLYRATVPGSGQNRAFRVVNFRPGGWLRLADVHLLDLKAFTVDLHANAPGELELRYGSPEGELLARATTAPTTGWNETARVRLPLPASAGGLEVADVYLVWKGEGGVVSDDMGHHRPGDLGWVDVVGVE